MIRTLILSLLALAAFTAPAAAQPSICPPEGYDREALIALKAADFEIENDRARNRFARALTACLASPDPVLRDQIAYEALGQMMRRSQLSEATTNAIADTLIDRMVAEDLEGFEAPFAALVLAEVVRVDRLYPFLSETRRARILDAAIAYFVAIRDYRGFDEREGWRHGVAHGADLLMQIGFNDAYGRDAHLRIRDAVAAQIAPEGHAYIYGEGERLARPILVIARRGTLSEYEWSEWFAAISAPAPLSAWSEAFSSQAGLAKRHNLYAFLYPIYFTLEESTDDTFSALGPGVRAALQALP